MAKGTAAMRTRSECGAGDADLHAGHPRSKCASVATKRGHRTLTRLTEVVSHLVGVADRMHSVLMDRADALMGCIENSAQEADWRPSTM